MADDESMFPRIASTRSTRLSNWVTLVENRVVASARDEGAIYHSIDTMDYVSVLALTADRRVPLVRQFRPAPRRFTLEFPGGMRDGDEARRRARSANWPRRRASRWRRSNRS